MPTARPVDIVPMPQVIVDENRCKGTVSGEMFPEEPDVGPAKIVEKANTGGATNEQHLHDDQNFKKTTITKLPTDFIEIPKPTLPRVCFKVAEEASTDGTTNEQCLYENQNYTKTTITKLPMDFLEIPRPSFTRGFVELAEEARNGGVESEQWFLVDEVLPQVTGMTKPAIEPVSRLLEEELRQFVEVTWEAPSRVAPVKYEAGHMMEWPNIKSDGVMIDGIMLESEMSPVGSVRSAAEPVLLAAKSEVSTPVVFAGGGGGVVAAAAPLAVVEAVTARVSVLPVVGSELSAAVGVTEQLVVDLGDTLDKVGHGAGQSCVRIVPAERLLGLREVRDILFPWIRPVAVLTSLFFLSDENGEVDMPSRRNGGRASL